MLHISMRISETISSVLTGGVCSEIFLIRKYTTAYKCRVEDTKIDSKA
jgi:hypothetical protein